MREIVSFAVGLLFALGLGLGGMTRPELVKGFLDVFGEWRPELLGVMAGAISVYALVYRLALRRRIPVLDAQFHLPTKTLVDGRLVAGAIIFGLGWGWAGICPGPGIVALASGGPSFLVFVVAMLAGMALFKAVEKRFP